MQHSLRCHSRANSCSRRSNSRSSTSRTWCPPSVSVLPIISTTACSCPPGPAAGTSSSSSQTTRQAQPSWLHQLSVGLLASALVCQPVHADAMSLVEEQYAMSEEVVMSEQEARYDENLMTPELKDFLQLLEKKGTSIKTSDLETPRLKVGFKRAPNGLVYLQDRYNTWYAVRPDMQSPGFLVLRSEATGGIYYLPPDDSGLLMQVDLSDDAVVAQLFSSGAWYDVMEPLLVKTGDDIRPMTMSPQEFRIMVTVLDDVVEMAVRPR